MIGSKMIQNYPELSEEELLNCQFCQLFYYKKDLGI